MSQYTQFFRASTMESFWFAFDMGFKRVLKEFQCSGVIGDQKPKVNPIDRIPTVDVQAEE